MNIFISWSGENSKEIANAIKLWLPMVLQAAKPYFTPSDIEKGAKWESEITTKLNECKIGLICLTKDNTEKPWILFEAGALSNKLDKSRVCPILFGLTNSDLKGPLATFQTTEFKKDDFRKLIKSINLLLEDNEVPDVILDEVFEMFYPKLEAQIDDILAKVPLDTTAEEILKRTDRDILEEILQLTRKQYNKPSEFIDDNLSFPDLGLPLLSFEAATKLVPGDRVRHDRFGAGTVTSMTFKENNLKDTRIEIKFDNGGTKKLLLIFAALSKL